MGCRLGGREQFGEGPLASGLTSSDGLALQEAQLRKLILLSDPATTSVYLDSAYSKYSYTVYLESP